MTDLHVTKHGMQLKPADADSEEIVRKLKPGTYMRVSITRPRNGKFHRKFFALLGAVRYHMSEQAEERWPTTDRLLLELKYQTGLYDWHETIGGKRIPIARSISWAKMDQDEFDKFYADCFRFVRQHIIPGITEDDLRAAAEQEIEGFSG